MELAIFAGCAMIPTSTAIRLATLSAVVVVISYVNHKSCKRLAKNFSVLVVGVAETIDSSRRRVPTFEEEEEEVDAEADAATSTCFAASPFAASSASDVFSCEILNS